MMNVNILQSKLLNKEVRTVPLCAAGITLSPPFTNVICLILPSNIVDLVPVVIECLCILVFSV